MSYDVPESREEVPKSLEEDEIAMVAERLRRAYPHIGRHKQAEGVLADSVLDSLLRAILSQNTNDRNRDRAFRALKEHYPTWYDMALSPITELATIIRATNYSYTKAVRIQQILNELYREYGEFSLDFLRDWPTERVMEYLQHFSGVGAKSAAIVCLFALKRSVMPVDVHVYRVTLRLGWVPEHTTPEHAQRILQELIPSELIYPLHIGLWEHGRLTCRPEPRCGQCAIYQYCIFVEKTAPRPPVEVAIAITSIIDQAA